jgi:hypothetical protein
MIGSSLDSRNIVHLPGWAKAAVITTLSIGFLLCVATVIRFLGVKDNTDWLLLGISSIQFIITALIASIIVFFSQNDANIKSLKARTDNFLSVVLRDALSQITVDGVTSDRITVDVGKRPDLFGHEIILSEHGTPILRMWCGLNVHRIIVIYHFVNPNPDVTSVDFTAMLKEIFRFTFGGAETLKYNVSYEPVPGSESLVSVWATVAGERGLLTDPAEKLFWAQDIAMMTESVIRTSRRSATVVSPSLSRPTGPL